MISGGRSGLVVGLGLEDERLRRGLTQQLEAAGCEVEAYDRRGALADRLLAPVARFALLIADAEWLWDRPFGELASAGGPVLAVESGRDAPRCERPIATARLRIGGDGDEAKVARLARHLIEQDRRWGGRWISTGLLQLAARSPSPEERDHPSRVPPSD